jgi:radical SAM superfamily enzyme YgiQ (UPF0313 family)
MHLALVDVSRHQAEPTLVLHILTAAAHAAGWTCSLHGFRQPPPPHAHAIAFTLSTMLYSPNVPGYLRRAGIPTRATDRDDSHPLILAGGQALTNPAPLAPFLDLVYLGEADAEPGLTHVLLEIADHPRQQALDRLAQLDHCYLPDRKPAGRWIRAPRPWSQTPLLIGRARLVTEAARGCPYNCAYCGPARTQRPYRWRSAADVLAGIPDHPGDVCLTTTSDPTHPQIRAILEGLHERGAIIRAGSGCLRDLDEDLLRAWTNLSLGRIGIGVEGPTAELRRSIGKPISDEALTSALHMLGRHVPIIRMYLIPGLPGHTPADTDAFLAWLRVTLATRPRSWRGGHPASIHVLSMPLQALPHTRLSHAAWAGDELLQHWRDQLMAFQADHFRPLWIKNPPMARIMFALARCGSEIAPVLDAMHQVRCQTPRGARTWRADETEKFYRLMREAGLELPLQPRQIPNPPPWSTVKL